MDRLNTYLKKAREKAKLSQAELGARLGHQNGQFVSNCERNLSQYPLSSFHKLSKVLKVKVEKLVDLYVLDIRDRTEFDLSLGD